MRFHISDVFLPRPEEALIGLISEAEAEGTIISFSDSGSMPRVFAIVEVGKGQTVVVPVVKVQSISSAGVEKEE